LGVFVMSAVSWLFLMGRLPPIWVAVVGVIVVWEGLGAVTAPNPSQTTITGLGGGRAG